MRRELPNHPHIDHLKKQAKDLLDAHKRGETDALERIVTHLPAFARLTTEQARAAPFALHDAQSAIARECGFASWNELRAEVERRASRAVPDSILRAIAGRPLPPDVRAGLVEVWDARGPAEPPPEDRSVGLPLLAFRGAVLTPGAVAPIHVARASSIAAIEAAMDEPSPRIAVLTQRDAATDDPGAADLHPVGCVAVVKKRIATEVGVFIIVEGQWWAELETLTPAGDPLYPVAKVRPFRVHEDLGEDDRNALVASLRERTHVLARGMPQPDRVTALVDSIRAPDRLADLVVANLPGPVEDKLGYACRPTLGGRLRAAIAMCDALITASR
jgi:hypothetical protein